MKKLFTLFFALVATTTLWAEYFEINGIYYNILKDKTNEVEVTYRGSYSVEYNEYSGSVTIPASVTYNGTTYSVTSIGDEVFYQCFGLTSITIPNSVTSIGNYAFYDCDALTSITIPNSVTSIGYRAFYGCSGLTSPVYNAHCFAYMPYSYEGTTYVIPSGIKHIAGAAFWDCSGLTSITIPNSVTSIGEYAFCSCTSLTSITIPNSVTSIGTSAFSHCSGLTSITIPNSVTSIGTSAFSHCSGLTSITIPNSVTSIESSAFYNCSGLTSINIPNSVTSIGDRAFDGCSGLTSIIIPNSVTSIGDYAFSYCSSLTSVTIGNSVTSIGKWAFEYCSSLTSVTIGNSVTSIGNSAFRDCSSLTSITIGNSVTSIGESAFERCSSLDTLTCLAMTPPALGEDVFYRCDNPTFFVPCEALSDYQLHEQWGQFTTIECIASEEAETEEVVIESGTTTVIITWPTEEGADTYSIVITKDGEVFCTLTFNSNGQLLNIAFAPGRNGNRPAQYAEQAGNGYRFTVTSLESGTKYGYNIDVKDASNKTIKSHSGEFITQSTTAVDNITTTTANIQKILRNGQLLILRDGVEYNAMGAQIQ